MSIIVAEQDQNESRNKQIKLKQKYKTKQKVTNQMKEVSSIVIENESNKKQYLAFLIIIISQIIFPLTYVFVNQHNVHPVQTTLTRGFAFILVSFIIGKSKSVRFQKSIRNNFYKFFTRNSIVAFHFLSITVLQYFLPLSLLYTLNCSGPIFVFIWDYFLHGISINRQQILGVILGCLGVFLAINGQKIYVFFNKEFETKSKFENFIVVSKELFFLISVGFALVTVIWAYSASMIKTIKMKDASEMMMHYGLLLIFMSGLAYPSLVTQQKPLSIYIQVFFYTSLPSALAQYLFTKGMTLTRNSGVASIFMFFTVIVGYSLSILRYDENINPIGIIGSIFILSGLTIVIFWKIGIEKLKSTKINPQILNSQLLSPEKQQTKCKK